MDYVLGFLIQEDSIVLIRKRKPEWQAGKLNGVGGKIEAGEVPYVAMCREFKEETGGDAPNWYPFQEMKFLGYGPETIRVFCFVAHDPEGKIKVATVTDEEVVKLPLSIFFGPSVQETVFIYDLLHNIPYLVTEAVKHLETHGIRIWGRKSRA